MRKLTITCCAFRPLVRRTQKGDSMTVPPLSVANIAKAS